MQIGQPILKGLWFEFGKKVRIGKGSRDDFSILLAWEMPVLAPSKSGLLRLQTKMPF